MLLRKLLATVMLALPLMAAEKPRAVVIFYTDDLGYNDTSTYGCDKVPCPHLDKLADEGLLFTDAHSTNSVCTPSRYSLLMGEYAWRKKGMQILPGDAKLILPTAEEQASLPSLMRQAGYRTAVIGKWHLGLGRGTGPTDWNRPISPGPNEVGFDHSFILAATGDRVPCVYIENGKVVNLDPADPIRVSYKKPFEGEPLGSTHPQLLKPWAHSNGPQHNCAVIDGIPRIGYMTGGKAALWTDQDMADRLTEEAIKFIKESARMGKPIFLYFATNDIHVPRDPHHRFKGKSQMGIRGDVTVQMDDCLGRVRAALNENGYQDCLFIFSSDNGPVINDGYFDGSIRDCKGHNPVYPMNAGRWRDGKLSGGKYGIMEGSTRVPFIVCWPGHTPAGEVSPALMSQVDLARTLCELAGADIPQGALPDSRNMLPSLLGQDTVGAPYIIEADSGRTLAIRKGPYKAYTGGKKKHLYHVTDDLQETRNLADTQQEQADQLLRELQEAAKEKK
ncbi:MAG: arylsulfatase [Akkermansiaceae bacterium]|nr:arylsulfatase [Akkermansiaceae bacterium]